MANKNDERKIAIYSRKSKFTGKGESVENQIEMCRKKIGFLFHNVDMEKNVIIYEDEGFTGANTKRPKFQMMMKDIRDKKIKTIVFYKLDRISRNVNDFSNLLTELDRYDVNFISATENLENITPTGKAMVMMTSVFSQLERDTIAERIRDNMLELAKTGRWLGGNTPTGFGSLGMEYLNQDGKKKKLFKLIPIAEEKELVKIIFDKYLQLKSQTKLETYLLQNNITTKNGKPFQRWGLVNILTNPVYAIADQDTLNYFKRFNVEVFASDDDFNGKYGIMAYNKTEKKGNSNVVLKKDINEWIIAIGKHEGFISGKDWVEVQELLGNNASKRYRKPTINEALLSGLLRCSHCGSFMRPKLKSTFDENGRRKFNYMCELKEKSRKKHCQCKNINGIEVDNAIMKTIQDLARPKSKFYLAIKDLAKGIIEGGKEDSRIKYLEAQYKKNERDIKVLLDKILIADTDLLDDLQKKIKEKKTTNNQIEKELKERKCCIPNEISDKETANIILDILNNYYSTFENLDLITKRNLVKLLVSSCLSDGVTLIIHLLGAREQERKPTVPLCEDSK